MFSDVWCSFSVSSFWAKCQGNGSQCPLRMCECPLPVLRTCSCLHKYILKRRWLVRNSWIPCNLTNRPCYKNWLNTMRFTNKTTNLMRNPARMVVPRPAYSQTRVQRGQVLNALVYQYERYYKTPRRNLHKRYLYRVNECKQNAGQEQASGTLYSVNAVYLSGLCLSGLRYSL